MLDTCILNVKNRTLYDPSCCREPISIDDVQEKSGSFISVLAHELKNKRLQIVKNKNGGHNVFADGKIIVSVKNGQITALNLPNTTMVGDNFLKHNETLETLNAQNLTIVGNDFLWFNKILHTLNAQNLTIVGNDFLRCNNMFKILDMHKLTTVGRCFLQSNKILQILNAQNLTTVGDYFLWFNENLQILNTPKLKRIGKISSTLKALLQKAQTRNPFNNKKLNTHIKNTVTISIKCRKNSR